MALSYREVSDLYDTLKSAGVVQESLSDWSTLQNRKRNNHAFDAGVNDNFVKQASTNIDRALDWTGLPDIGEGFGRAVGSAVGRPDAGADIGRSLPRMFVDFAPLGIPYVGPAITGALSGAEAYTNSGSVATGVTSGITNAIMPKVFEGSAQAALRMFGDQAGKLEGPLLDAAGRLVAREGGEVNPKLINRLMPITRTQGVTSFLAGQAGAAALGEASSAVQAGMDPNRDYEFDPVTAALNMTLGQLPFAAPMLMKGGRMQFGGRTAQEHFRQARVEIAQTESALKVGAELNAAKENTPGTVPPASPMDPAVFGDLQSRLDALRGERRARTDAEGANSTEEEINLANNTEFEQMRKIDQETGGQGVIGGSVLNQNSKRMDVFGTEHGTNRNGTYRIVEVKNLRGQDLRYTDGTKIDVGDLVGFPTGSEPEGNRQAGQTNFSVPREANRREIDRPLYKGKEKPVDNFQDLPEQSPRERTTQNLKSGKEILDGAEASVAKALTIEDFEGAIHELNGLRGHYDLPPLDNAAIAKRRKWLDSDSASMNEPTDKAVVQSLIHETRKQTRRAEVEASRLEDSTAFGEELSRMAADPEHPQNHEATILRDLQNRWMELGNDENSNYQKVVTSGLFKKKAQEALANGSLLKKDGVENFQAQFASAISRGKGLEQNRSSRAREPITKEIDTDLRQDLLDQADAAGRYAEMKEALDADNVTRAQEILSEMNQREEGEAYGQHEGQDDSEGRAYGDVLPSPRPLRASSDFLWNFAGIENDKLGGKHTIPKAGFTEAQFQNAGGPKGTALNKVEVATLKLVAPEAFADGKVDVRLLEKLVKEREGSVVKTEVYGQEKQQNPEEAEFAQLRHELETGTNGYRYEGDTGIRTPSGELVLEGQKAINPTEQAFLTRYQELADRNHGSAEGGPRATSFYNTITSRKLEAVKESGGRSIRVDVMVPKKETPYVEEEIGTGRKLTVGVEQPDLWTADNLHENLPNTLGWAWVHELPYEYFAKYEPHLIEKLGIKPGEKIMQVDEQQSRWGQERRKEEIRQAGFTVDKTTAGFIVKNKEGEIVHHGFFKTEEEARQRYITGGETPFHPLLEVQHNLVLKYAIVEAEKAGVDRMFVVDGPSAGITEGHDKAIVWKGFTSREQANDASIHLKFKYQHIETVGDGTFTITGIDPKYFDTIKAQNFGSVGTAQQEGMAVHYDQTLQSAMQKLTGEKGQRVEDFGQHAAAESKTTTEPQTESGLTPEQFDARKVALESQGAIVESNGRNGGVLRYRFNNPTEVVGSPVFKDATGAPKTQISGTIYDLTKAKQTLRDQGGFTMSVPARAPKVPWKPVTEKNVQLVQKVGTTGKSLLEYLHAYDKNPALAILAGDLKALGLDAALDRVSLGWIAGDDYGTSFAQTAEGRTVRINLSQSLAMMSDFGRNSVMVHELLHGLTLHELANPAKAEHRNALESLRQQVMKQVSPELRAIVKKALKSNWYERYANDEAGMEELTTNAKLVNSAYALLNVDEFVSQTFSSGKFRKLLTGIKVENTTGLVAFRNWIEQIIGLKHVEGTMLEEVLNTTNNILSDSKSVATVRNFAENYFGKQGLNSDEVQGWTDRFVGLVASAESKPTKGEILSTIFEHEYTTNTLELARVHVDKVYAKGGPEQEFYNMAMEEAGYTTNREGFEGFVKDMLTGDGKNIHEWIEILPDAMKPLLFERANDAAVMLKALHDFDDPAVLQWMNVRDMAGLRAGAKDALDATQVIMQADADTQIAHRHLQGLTGLDPVGAVEAMVKSPGKLLEPKEMSWLERNIWKPATVILNHPALTEAVDKGYTMLTRIRQTQLAGHAPFAVDLDTGLSSEAAFKNVIKATGNTRVARAWSKIVGLSQLEGQKTGKTVTLKTDNAQVQEVLKGLSATDKNSVLELLARKDLSTQRVQLDTLDSMRKVIVTRAASLIADITGFKVNRNVEIADAVMEYALTDFTNPQKAAMANQKMMGIQQEIPPQALDSLISYLTSGAEKWRNTQQHFAENPGWASAQRMGDYETSFANGHFDKFDSRAEAEQYAKEHRTTVLDKTFKKVKENQEFVPHFGAGTESWIAQMRQFDKNMQDIMVAKHGPEILKDMQRFSATEQFAVVAKAAGVKDVTAHGRRLSKGAEDLNYGKNHFSWISKTSNYWARELYKAEISLARMDPEIQSRQDYKDYIQQLGENTLSPDPSLARTATRFTTHWLLGANVGAAIVNGTQVPIRGVGALTALNGKPLRNYLAMGRAMKEVGTGQGKWGTAEHEWVRQQATHDGEIGLTVFDTEAATNESVAANMKRHIAGQGPLTVADHAKTLLGGAQTASMWMFRQVEQFNTSTTLLMGFDHFRAEGMSKEQAYQEARRFNHGVNDVGGKVNRSVGLFSGKDPFSKSAAMIANSMQAYVFGSTHQLITNIRKGFFDAPGFTPHEKYAAKLAAVQMLSVQMAMAGTLGMPFVAGGIAILEKLFPNLELNKNLRNLLVAFMHEDETTGHMFSDAAATGIPSLLGWDWQSRLSMGSLPGVSEYNGFQVDQLIGAPLSVATGLFRGATELAQGNPKGVRDLMPPAARKILELIQAGGGPLKDSSGQPTMQPTPGETVGMLAGFQPKRKMDFYAAQQMALRADRVANQKTATFRQDMANIAIEGKFGNVQAQLRAKRDANPDFDVRGEIQAIARQAESLAFMRDLRRSGSTARGDILSKFNLPSDASEAARLEFRRQIEGQLGLVTRSQGRDQQVAGLMDQLRQQMPDATRSELRQLAEQTLRRQMPPSLPGYQ